MRLHILTIGCPCRSVGPSIHTTVGQINKKPRCKYWATHSSVRSFTRTAHSFACSTLLASLARSAALTYSLAHFAHSLPCGKVNDQIAIHSVFFSVLDHSAYVHPSIPCYFVTTNIAVIKGEDSLLKSHQITSSTMTQ